MEKLLSNKINIQFVPESYVFPPEKRPGNHAFPRLRPPVVDLGGEYSRNEIVRQISEAGKEYGFFQVINHGISGKLIHDMLTVGKEFFEMPVEDKAKFYSEDKKQLFRIFTSTDYNQEKIHFWRDSLRQYCHPVEQFAHLWPEKPSRYREVAQTYSIEVRKLGLRLLELINEGLGLELMYFRDELVRSQVLVVNYIPPCPDPKLTLGVGQHCDPNSITILQEDGSGFQVLKDGQWYAVEPLANAFVVDLGLQLRVISNGKLKSTEHRVVTNSSTARTSVVAAFFPSNDAIIGPASQLVNASSPALYRDYQFMEFVTKFMPKPDDTEAVLESFKLCS